MANKKFSDLTAATTLAASDLFAVETATGNSRKITKANVQTALAIGTFLIEEQSPSGTGTASFTSIPTTYRDLLIVIRGRGTTAATQIAANIRFNNDSAANYARTRIGSSGSGTVTLSASVSQTEIAIGSIPAASATASYAGTIDLKIFDYRGTTFFKEAHGMHGYTLTNANNDTLVEMHAGFWRSAAAINRVDVILASGSFVAGSVVSLYGVM